ncbi:MAG: PTS sugar transporter subunit IIA [bacterium]|nr:PTS sugar transporter subunit IIA [bacterium]
MHQGEGLGLLPVENQSFSGTDVVHAPKWGPGTRLNATLMVPELQATDRMGAIKELVDRFYQTGGVSDSLRFLQSVLDREDLESTVVDRGVAFPHARCRSVAGFGVAFGISQRGVDFYSDIYPEPVHLICMLAVPMVGAVKHLALLGHLAGLFQQEDFQFGLRACHTAGDMHDFLVKGILEYQAKRLSVASHI